MTQLLVLRQPDADELEIPGSDPTSEAPHASVLIAPENRVLDRLLAASVTLLPPCGFVLAIYLHAQGLYHIGPIELGCWLVMHAVALLGVELGFHRLFAHKSYKAHRVLKIMLALAGSLAFQGPPIWWVAVHRKHHRYSDRPNDPHSVYIKADGTTRYNQGFWQLVRGFLHAHLGWVWSPWSTRFPGWAGYVRDLYRDPDLLWIHMRYGYWLAGGFIAPALAAGVLHRSLRGALLGLLWGGFVRVFVMNHLTYWTINTVSHSVGARPFRTADRSRNSIPLLFALPTLGQSYHNNHHAFPYSARMSLAWHEVDVGRGVLLLLQRLRLVWDLREPTREALQRKRIRSSRA